MKGPSIDMKGPSIDMKVPSIDMKGPSIDMKGPSIDMKDPSINMKGSSIDMKGRSNPVEVLHLSVVSAIPPPPPLPKSGDLTFIKSNAPWLGVNITGQFAAPFAVDHTQCQIPRTRAGRNNGQIPH